MTKIQYRDQDDFGQGVDLFDFIYEIWRARISFMLVCALPLLVLAAWHYGRELALPRSSPSSISKAAVAGVDEQATVGVSRRLQSYSAQYRLDNSFDLAGRAPAVLVMDALARGLNKLDVVARPRALAPGEENTDGRLTYRVIEAADANPDRGDVILEVPSDVPLDMDALQAAIERGSKEQLEAALDQARRDVKTLEKTMQTLAGAGSTLGETIPRNLYLVSRFIQAADELGSSLRFVNFGKLAPVPPSELAPIEQSGADQPEVSPESVAQLEPDFERLSHPSTRNITIAALIGLLGGGLLVMFRIAIERGRKKPGPEQR